jgi:hypothetical protein
MSSKHWCCQSLTKLEFLEKYSISNFCHIVNSDARKSPKRTNTLLSRNFWKILKCQISWQCLQWKPSCFITYKHEASSCFFEILSTCLKYLNPQLKGYRHNVRKMWSFWCFAYSAWLLWNIILTLRGSVLEPRPNHVTHLLCKSTCKHNYDNYENRESFFKTSLFQSDVN